MAPNTLTVVVPVHNREQLVIRCLESIKAQTLRPLEVVVVDNASTDGTRHAVADWAAANTDADFQVILVDEPQPGAARARNCGLAEVQTEYMLFFDSDDVMLPHMVDRIMATFRAAINRGTPLDLVYWRTETILGAHRRKLSKFTLSRTWQYHIYHALLATQCYAVRTDFIRAVDGWNPDLGGWDDWELGVRLLLGNPRLEGINAVLARIYPQRNSITGENFHSKAGEWERAIDAAERAVAVSGRTDSDMLTDMLNYRRAILAAHYHREHRDDLANELLTHALSHPVLTPPRRLLLRLLYLYTALGGRGAALLWR